MSNGIVLYQGPSQLDGAPIIVIATGLANASRNSKTGDLIQTWIIREDIAPHHAVKSGADASVCGDCPHRGSSCYVAVHQAPLSVWKSFHRGIYARPDAAAVRALFAGRAIRLGSYGDPAAVPFDVWANAMAEAKSGTGYTHQWKRAQALQQFCMASCDSVEDHAQAKAMGWRTFRVRTNTDELLEREIACPASKEMGAKTNCAACRACFGLSARAKVDIAIIAHGARKGAFMRQAD